MSTILCRQPSMDSSINILEPTTIKLKLVSPKSFNPKSLFTPSSYKSIDDYFYTNANSYPHSPKSFKLSQKSLELCTESLGSETGSYMSENDVLFAAPVSSSSVTKSGKDKLESKKVVSRSLPPPLTSTGGTKLFEVRPRREGGRLIIEAIETDLGNGCLRVERSEGRLQLICWKNEEDDLDIGSNESDMKDLEKVQRIRRCTEDENGDKGICCNWEPSCWVAIS